MWILFCYMCFVLVCYNVLSVPRSIVVTCWEKIDLLAHFDVISCLFLTFQYYVLGSGVVFDCIDSRSLPSSLILLPSKLIS